MEDLITDLNYINELKNQAYEKCYEILGESPTFFNPYWAVRLCNHEFGTNYTVDDVAESYDCLEYYEAIIGGEYTIWFDYRTGEYNFNGAPEGGGGDNQEPVC